MVPGINTPGFEQNADAGHDAWQGLKSGLAAWDPNCCHTVGFHKSTQSGISCGGRYFLPDLIIVLYVSIQVSPLFEP